MKKHKVEDKKVAAFVSLAFLLFLSFLRKQESIFVSSRLDPRLRGDDEHVSCVVYVLVRHVLVMLSAVEAGTTSGRLPPTKLTGYRTMVRV